jgi:hypothetical protein
MAIMTIPSPVGQGGKEFGEIILNEAKAIETQSVYCRYAKTSEKDGVTTIDISDVPDFEKNNIFYVNSKEPVETWIGCDVYDYKKNECYATYVIKPISNVMKFDNV